MNNDAQAQQTRAAWIVIGSSTLMILGGVLLYFGR